MMKIAQLKGNAFMLAALLSCALALTLTGACSKPNSNSNQSAAAPPRQQPQTEFERDLAYARKGSFTHIYVFARKDGQPFQPDDITYLKANSPAQTNQWLSTDNGRRVIAGSNFDFEPEHFAALNQRFTVEDYTGK